VASEDATRQGITVKNPDGTTSVKPAVEVLGDALLAFRNGTGMAFPYGTLLNALEVAGNGEAFHAAFTHCDGQIALAVLHQTLATLEAQYQARASSEVHQDTLETIIRQAKRAVCLMLRRDVLRPMVAYNYGPDAARTLTPTVSLGSVERQDLAAMMTAIAQLARAGYLDGSQYQAIDAQLNLPVREAAPEEPPPSDQGDQPGPVPPDGMAEEDMEGEQEDDDEPV
jgi:phage gp29-like protein